MKSLLAGMLAVACCAVFAQQLRDLPETVEGCDASFEEVVKKHASVKLTTLTAKPDGAITADIQWLIQLANQALALPEDAKAKAAPYELAAKIEQAVAILQERRVYCYLLWAERRLQDATAPRYEDLGDCSQDELIRLYEDLSDINLALVSEPMLARDVAARLGEIYDAMDGTYKVVARRRGIEKQMDSYSAAQAPNVKLRKTLDDF